MDEEEEGRVKKDETDPKRSDTKRISRFPKLVWITEEKEKRVRVINK